MLTLAAEAKASCLTSCAELAPQCTAVACQHREPTCQVLVHLCCPVTAICCHSLCRRAAARRQQAAPHALHVHVLCPACPGPHGQAAPEQVIAAARLHAGSARRRSFYQHRRAQVSGSWSAEGTGTARARRSCAPHPCCCCSITARSLCKAQRMAAQQREAAGRPRAAAPQRGAAPAAPPAAGPCVQPPTLSAPHKHKQLDKTRSRRRAPVLLGLQVALRLAGGRLKAALDGLPHAALCAAQHCVRLCFTPVRLLCCSRAAGCCQLGRGRPHLWLACAWSGRCGRRSCQPCAPAQAQVDLEGLLCQRPRQVEHKKVM